MGEGESFGPYRLVELLGRGGMGEVYRALDTDHDRYVALKRLAPHLADDTEFQHRFGREAHHVAKLRDPHVVTIHRYGSIDDRLFIDMQLIDGGDLLGLIERSGPLPVERAVVLLEQVASALDEAHESGLVHRDVKPSNILLDGRLANFCYLADWGITRPMTTGRSHSLTRTGALLGSLAYMAPEQFDGAVSAASDVYALTCVFFEMITGRPPYAGEGLPMLMHSHMKVPPPHPSQVLPHTQAFDEVVGRGMAKDAAERFSSAGALARAAREALDVPHATAAQASAAVREETPDSGHTTRRRAASPPVEATARPRLKRVVGHRGLVPAAAGVAVLAVLVAVGASLRGASAEANAPVDTRAGATTTAAPAAIPPVAATPTRQTPVVGEAVYTGRTSGNELTVAIGVKDGRVAGYLCDGKAVEAWLEGTIDGDRVVLHGGAQGTSVEATADQLSLLGTVTVGGVQRSFSAQVAKDAEGLYQSRRTVAGIATRIGWIVLPDGNQVGIVKRGDVRSPAPQLNPVTRQATDGGTIVTADRLSGESTVLG
ncbi:serine/threonine protein kinase [Pseudonocardia sp. RS11V-5]|uniref:serine/threonine-protein kinase n=1 Tax=Pseudonocardia terrae TaxID=2905831 RepID=UPI001E606881|nr:serine/threonine-protein kinase [Pseudonocardia terrae]MCE3552392.1 serine/threonine protein kinase [Pseudonocardia terrae]